MIEFICQHKKTVIVIVFLAIFTAITIYEIRNAPTIDDEDYGK